MELIIETVIELSEAEKAKIKQNEQEEALFRKNLHSLINGDKRLASRPLVIGKTPNIFAVCDKNVNADNDLVITKKVIEKCMRPELRDENGKRLKNSGHYLAEGQLAKALENLKEPVMVLKGSLDNTFVAVTDFKDNKDKEIIIAIEINKSRAFGEVNKISSAYGRDDFPQYIKDNLNANNIIAINIEKANKMLHSIGVDFPEENTFISFDNSIAYSTTNVKYITENSQNISSEKENVPSDDGGKEMNLLSVEITQADIDVLRTLEPRKSILNFTEAELAATKKWAEKFQGELSEKSPFYRLTNGDWRENDENRVPIIDVDDKSPTFQSVREDIKQQVIFRGSVVNSDTDWNIQISRKGIEDSISYAFKHKDLLILNLLYQIDDIVNKSVYLDTNISEHNNNNKSPNTAFMHKLYIPIRYDNKEFIGKVTVEEMSDNQKSTLQRFYNLQDIKIEPLRHVSFTDKQPHLKILNGSDISISDLFKLVKNFDKDFYLNKRSEKQIERLPTGDTERNDNMDEQTLLLERIAALEKQVAAMTAEQQNLKEQINTVNQFISSITESQNFEQSMSTIESMGKQVLDCGKAEFWCYDGAENKYFTNDENRGGRDWQIAKENMRIAAESRDVHIADGEAYIPIISNDKVAGILVASEKDGAFDRTSLEKFAPNGQIANTIDLSLKKEFEHQGRITDELTRLKNRQGAKEYAANTMAHNVNSEKDMCLIMCDIDHFKSINDTYGHDAGDTVLKNVAGILQSGTRQGADSAFRWGGEEMVCVLNCDYDHAMDIAERLRQQIESTTHLVYNADKEPVSVGVTISMGVYQVKPDKEITQETAFVFFENQLKFADELAYKAKETGRNKVVGENDIMIEKNAEKENYSVFFIDNGIETAYYRDDNTDINALVQRIADSDLSYPEISKNCTRISELTFTELDQMGDSPPAFCAEINLKTQDIIGHEKPMELTVWDNDKIATINLDEAIQSLKENGTVNLDYHNFPEDNDTVELESEYLDFSEHLNDVYDDFMYHNSIFNNEHIKFVDEHGELPPNLDTAENRALVSEYINDQLNSGNITESQKASLENLRQEIRDFEEPLFNQTVGEMAQWADDVIDRSDGRDEQDRNDVER